MASSSTKRVPHVPSLADRVGRAFSPRACVRGYQIFVGAGVALEGISPTRIDANVRGTRAERVTIIAEGVTLGVACSCSVTALEPPRCGHVWAALLEIDRRGELSSLRLAPTTRLGALALPDTEASAAPSGRPKRGAKPSAEPDVSPTDAAPATRATSAARATPAARATQAARATPSTKPRTAPKRASTKRASRTTEPLRAAAGTRKGARRGPGVSRAR